MHMHEIFKALSEPMRLEITGGLFEQNCDIYSAAVQKLAPMQNLRPIFVQRKALPARHKWLAGALSRRMAESVTAELLQVWLTTCQKEMMTGFLDTLGIQHDGNGLIEEMPAGPEEAALREAIDALLAKYPRETVVLYLHLFVYAGGDPWPALSAMLREEDRLQLSPEK